MQFTVAFRHYRKAGSILFTIGHTLQIMETKNAVQDKTAMLKKLFPKYTWIEWALLSAMGLMLIIVPLVWPSSLAEIRILAIIVLFIGMMMNAFAWQEPSVMDEGYGVWLFLLIGGPIVAIVGHYAHALHAVILTGVGCAYTAPWGLLRVFLRRRFLSPTR